MKKLTNRQLEVMKELIEKRNTITSLNLKDYYLNNRFINHSIKEWEEAHNNIISINRCKYRGLVFKNLEEKQYIEVVERADLYIWVRILKEV